MNKHIVNHFNDQWFSLSLFSLLFLSFWNRERKGKLKWRSFDEMMDMEKVKDEQMERNRGGRKQVKVGTTRRNARERNRVRHINDCFEVLRQHIPHEKHNKKLSKVDTLKSAMMYIENLYQLLQSTSNFLTEHEQIYMKQETFSSYWQDQHQQQDDHSFQWVSFFFFLSSSLLFLNIVVVEKKGMYCSTMFHLLLFLMCLVDWNRDRQLIMSMLFANVPCSVSLNMMEREIFSFFSSLSLILLPLNGVDDFLFALLIRPFFNSFPFFFRIRSTSRLSGQQQ